MAQGFRSSPSAMGLPFGIGGLDVVRQVEAKYPALLFKQQLTPYVEKIYGIIRDNLKEDISALLGLCIQAPRTSRAIFSKQCVQIICLLRRECCSFSNGEYVKARFADLELWCCEATKETNSGIFGYSSETKEISG
ncbi:hypothetical protein SUGI_0279690 [Cryptomeria japonica]|nr:hypothetical protein SUGI_0279690 [Cryptomeria japonica]